MAETPAALDLTSFSEETRRTLYEWIARLQFPSEGKPTADDSGLQVIFLGGRWFASWLDLDEPASLPTPLRIRMVRVGLGADQQLELYEV
jgi:hypothetical protein